MSGDNPQCARVTSMQGELPIVCGVTVKRWRQCPVKACGLEIARCDGHGGDARAMALMIDHIAAHVAAGEWIVEAPP